MPRRTARFFDGTSLKTAGVILAAAAVCVLAGEPRCRLNPPEECARTQLRYIREAQQRFHRRNGRFGTLAELAEAAFVGPAMRLGQRDHYLFEVRLEGGSWWATARPMDASRPAFRIDADDEAPREVPR